MWKTLFLTTGNDRDESLELEYGFFKIWQLMLKVARDFLKQQKSLAFGSNLFLFVSYFVSLLLKMLAGKQKNSSSIIKTD